MSERTSWTIFVSGIVVLILLGLATAAVTSRYANSEEQVAQTHEVETALARVRASLQAAESASLSFFITGDLGSVRQYETATAELAVWMATLKTLTKDNPTQQARFAELTPWIAEDLSLMEQAIALKKSNLSVEAAKDPTRRMGDLTARAVATLQVMRDEENRLMKFRVLTSTTAYRNTFRLLMVAGIAVLLFLAIGFRLLLKGLSERKRAEAAVRRLSIRILQLRDMERRKIARDLHDSIGQSMAAVAMNLTMLKDNAPGISPEKRARLLSDSLNLVQQAVGETRTISHLLHPPLLDEAGFASAAKWYVDGFTQRSKIPVQLEIAAELGRLPREAELVLFRTLQEGLTNIHKHSGSTQVTVRLANEADNTVFTIQDNGKGIPAATLEEFERTGGGSGIGLAGMRERVQDLGGRFELHSDSRGTRVTVILPSTLAERATPASGDQDFTTTTHASSPPSSNPMDPMMRVATQFLL